MLNLQIYKGMKVLGYKKDNDVCYNYRDKMKGEVTNFDGDVVEVLWEDGNFEYIKVIDFQNIVKPLVREND